MKKKGYQLMICLYSVIGAMGIMYSFIHTFQVRCSFINGGGRKVWDSSVKAADSFRYVVYQIAGQMNRYLKFQLSAEKVSAEDGTKSVLFLFVLFVAVMLWEQLSRQKTYFTFLLLGAGFMLPFALRQVPEDIEVYMILLAGLGLVSLKNSREKSRGMIGVLLGVLAFFIGTVLIAPILQPMFRDRGEIQQTVTGIWERQLMQRIRGDKATGGVESGRTGDYGVLELGEDRQLLVTCAQKPAEKIYLQGFIGTRYEDNEWKEAGGIDFSVWCRGQDTDGREIRNILYTGLGQNRRELHIENTGANGAYRYIPYGAYYEKEYKLETDTYIHGTGEHAYNILYRPFQGGQIRLEEHQKTIEKEYRRFVREQYMEVPQHTKEAFEEVVTVNIAGGSAVQAAADIKNLLSTYADYSLSPGKTPAGKDTAEYFYFENKKGYCVHFASTGTLMMRLRGFPARYVTGYLAEPEDFRKNDDGKYEAVITGKAAHAWTEVYQNGAGWIPAEMTPGYGSAEENSMHDTEASEEYEDERELPEMSDEGEEGGTEESAASVGKAADEQTDIQKEQDRQKISVESRENKTGVTIISILLFAGVTLFVVFCVRKCFLFYGSRSRRGRNYAERTKVGFRQFFEMLVSAGVIKREAELDEEFVRLVSSLSGEVSIEDVKKMTDIVNRANYGRKKITVQEYCECDKIKRKISKSLIREMSLLQRLWWKYWKGI